MEHTKTKWAGNFPGERKERWKRQGRNDEEASFQWCHAGNEALGLPCLANCSFHDDACLPNTSFNGCIFSITFVKPLLLLTCWQELTCQLLKWLAVAIHVPWWKCGKCELPPFTKNLVKVLTSTWLSLLGGKNLPSGNFTSCEYSIIILLHRNKRGQRDNHHQVKS